METLGPRLRGKRKKREKGRGGGGCGPQFGGDKQVVTSDEGLIALTCVHECEVVCRLKAGVGTRAGRQEVKINVCRGETSRSFEVWPGETCIQ